jgi:hypothetical protein
MIQGLQDLDLPNGCDWETVLFLFGVDALESNNTVRHPVLADKDTSVHAFANLMLLQKDVYVAQDDRGHDGASCRAHSFRIRRILRRRRSFRRRRRRGPMRWRWGFSMFRWGSLGRRGRPVALTTGRRRWWRRLASSRRARGSHRRSASHGARWQWVLRMNNDKALGRSKATPPRRSEKPRCYSLTTEYGTTAG